MELLSDKVSSHLDGAGPEQADGVPLVDEADSRDGKSHPDTSSAFSAPAQPDEDGTKVSDLAERRRIQSKIAQRKYRKLKTTF